MSRPPTRSNEAIVSMAPQLVATLPAATRRRIRYKQPEETIPPPAVPLAPGERARRQLQQPLVQNIGESPEEAASLESLTDKARTREVKRLSHNRSTAELKRHVIEFRDVDTYGHTIFCRDCPDRSKQENFAKFMLKLCRATPEGAAKPVGRCGNRP